MKEINIEQLGLQSAPVRRDEENLYIGRVMSQNKNRYEAITEQGIYTAEVSGK